MTRSTPLAWILSIGLHGLIVLFAILAWNPKPLSDESPSISVDIIADKASAIGPITEVSKPVETANETPNVTEDEPVAEPLDTPASAPPPEQIPNPIPAQPTKAQPIVKPNQPPPPKMNAPTPKPEAPKQLTPQQKPQQVQPKAPAPKNNSNTPPLFDLAAATRAASGVNSGGRAQPKLSKSNQRADGANAGGGSRLQGDLASTLRNQVKDCWHEPADLSDPARLIVELQMELTLDGNFIRSRLVKPVSKAGADSVLLVAIDNAQRAARQCAPYDLPAERYDEWKSFIFRFDPRELRR